MRALHVRDLIAFLPRRWLRSPCSRVSRPDSKVRPRCK